MIAVLCLWVAAGWAWIIFDDEFWRGRQPNRVGDVVFWVLLAMMFSMLGPLSWLEWMAYLKAKKAPSIIGSMTREQRRRVFSSDAGDTSGSDDEIGHE